MTAPSIPATSVPSVPYQRPKPQRTDTLRLDGNEGSWPPHAVLERFRSLGAETLRNYPTTAELQSRIAERHGVDAARIVVTAGVDDGLDRTFRAFVSGGREAVIPVPTFEMMYRLVVIAGGTFVPIPWRAAFPTEEVVERLGPETSLTVIVSPNNPTGAIASEDDLRRVGAAAKDQLVLFDHVYSEYADRDLTREAIDLPNVITFHTFSKAWGLAGCRVGYAIAHPEVAAVIRNAGSPYPIGGVSAAMAIAQIELGEDALQTHVQRIRKERAALTAFLRERGVDSPDSQANFVFADLDRHVTAVNDSLAARGVLVRSFPHRKEISTGVRISLPGNEGEFDRLLSTLETCLRELSP